MNHNLPLPITCIVICTALGCADSGGSTQTDVDADVNSSTEGQNETEVIIGTIPDCESEDPGMTSCVEVGALCNSPGKCCICAGFDAPSCDDQWDCATPSNNPEGCPVEAPELESECATEINLSCVYCANTGPIRFSCRTATLTWTEAAGLSCEE